MTTCQTTHHKSKMSVGMGQIEQGTAPCLISSVLGSCVGVCLYDPRTKTGAVGHIVLPSSKGRDDNPGKYADTAIPYMIDMMKKQGVVKRHLVAKIAGGASMFNAKPGLMQIGESNIEAVKNILKEEGFKVAAEDVSGTKGRRITLDCDTGIVKVEIAGSQSNTL